MSRKNEVLNFLEREAMRKQAVDGNYRLYLFEIVWSHIRDALSVGDQTEALLWADYGIRVCGGDPWCEESELNLRAWMIQRLGHQDENTVLDSGVLVSRFCACLT